LITRQVGDESRCKLSILLAQANPVNRVRAKIAAETGAQRDFAEQGKGRLAALGTKSIPPI
jgi:hypothetical protein